jgi:hypothetical protein
MNPRALFKSRLRRTLASAAAVLVAASAMVVGLSSNSYAQALPGPLSFVSNLDLECWQTTSYTPAFAPILTHHLNPVLSSLPDENVTLGTRQQECSPVANNSVIPPSPVLAFVQYTDLSCYAISGINVNFPVTLTQLDPVLAGLPAQKVVMTVPQQLCVPVIKDGQSPPAAVLALVKYIDLKCYAIQAPTVDFPVTLTQLDPVLAGLPVQSVKLLNSVQLCVPVQKDDQAIPASVLHIVQWVDLEKFTLTLSGSAPTVQLTLNHINPLLTGLPTETTTLTGPLQLAVPVAKNGVIPPTS